MGWLQGVGLAVGNNLLVGQKMEAQQAETEFRQQQTEMAKLANTETKEKQVIRKAVGAEIQALQSSSKVGEEAVAESITFYDRASAKLASKGDFDGAKQMSDLSKGKLAEGERMKESRIKTQVANTEALSQAAQSWLAMTEAKDPNASAYQGEIAKRAIAAGINVADIPAPNSPGFVTWASNVALQAKSASARLDFVQKGVESSRTYDRLVDNQRENLEERRLRRQESANLQQQGLDLRRTMVALAAEKQNNKIDLTISKNDFAQSQTLSKEAQKVAKPYLDDRKLTVDLQSALALGTSAGDKQAQAILTSLNSTLKSRATNKLYADNKYFGGAVDRVGDLASRMFTGKYSDSTRKELYDMVTATQAKVLDPTITRIERDQKAKAEVYGIDTRFVTLQGDFNRTEAPAAGPAKSDKAPGEPNRNPQQTFSIPEGTKPAMVKNGIEYFKINGTVLQRPVQSAQ